MYKRSCNNMDSGNGGRLYIFHVLWCMGDNANMGDTEDFGSISNITDLCIVWICCEKRLKICKFLTSLGTLWPYHISAI